MTFSTQTRLELTRVLANRRCCAAAELAAILRADGWNPKDAAADGAAVVTVGYPALARKVYTLVRRLDPGAEVRVERLAGRPRRRAYSVRIANPGPVLAAAKAALEPAGGVETPRKRCCRRAYIRGAFLTRGSLAAPAREYHFEIVVDDAAYAHSLVATLEALGQEARMSRRKGAFVVYVKEAEGIVDVLSLMGAHQALLELENVRIVKGMRNRVNRLVNCETANVDKTVNAALEQIEAIRRIEKNLGLVKLPPALSALARARLEHPYASLRELGDLLTPKVSKSGVGHRMRRLMQIAASLPPGETSDGSARDDAAAWQE